MSVIEIVGGVILLIASLVIVFLTLMQHTHGQGLSGAINGSMGLFFCVMIGCQRQSDRWAGWGSWPTIGSAAARWRLRPWKSKEKKYYGNAR